MTDQLFLLDGHYLIYRSYHAMSQAEMRDSSGQPTGAIYGVLRFLLTLMDDYDPDRLVFAMDSEVPTFRHEFYEEYKIQRPEMPDELRAQLPLIKELVHLMDIPIAREDRFESDDLIATMVEKWGSNYEKDDLEIVVVSNDKDNFQLVNDSVKILKQKQGLTEVTILDYENVKEELGVTPEQIPDYLSLVGDSVDNIPGVEGIGPTYASRILNEFNNVESIFDDPERLTNAVSDRLASAVRESREQIQDSKELVILRKDAPLDLDFEETAFDEIKVESLIEFCRNLNFRSIREELEDRIDFSPGWDDISVDWDYLEFSEFDREPDDFNQETLFVLGFAPEPDKKLMQIDEFLLALVCEDSGYVLKIPIESVGKGQFREFNQIFSKSEFYTYNQKFLQLMGYRLGITPESDFSEFDLQLGSYLKDPEQDHSLRQIISRTTGTSVPEFDDDWSSQKTCDWLIRQTWLLREACQKTSTEVQSRNQKSILDELELPLTRLLARMEHNGIKLDTDLLESLSDELEETLNELLHRAFDHLTDIYDLEDRDELNSLIKMVGGSFSLNSPKQIRSLLYDKLDLPVQSRTGTGKPSTDLNTLRSLRNHHSIVEDIIDFREAKTTEDDDSLNPEQIENQVFDRLLDIYDVNNSKELKELFDFMGGGFKVDSPKQLREIFFEKLDLPVSGRTDSGQPSTDVDALEELREEHPLVGVVLEYRKYKKVESTYLTPLVEAINSETKRLHTEFNQTIASTGRLSSSNPNLQNIPVREEFGRKVRSAFIPSKENYLLLGADYSQIELRLLAHMSQDEALINSFREGKDVHTEAASNIFDKQESAVDEDDRRVAKVVNYGIAYGLSEYGLARDLDISQEEAQDYIERYFSRYPGVRAFLDQTVERARSEGFVETLWGRRRYIPELNSDDYYQRQFAERAAVNAPIQGTAADLMKKAMIHLEPKLNNYDCNLLLQVHDELILESNQLEMDALETVVRDSMSEVIDLKVPVEVSIKTGKNWGEISK